MLNPIVTSSCNAARPFPAFSNPGILFPSAAAAIKSDHTNPNFRSCRERHINTFHNYLYFNTTSTITTTTCSLLRSLSAGSFLSSSLSGFSCSLTRTRGGHGHGHGQRDKNLSMGGFTDVAALDSSAARKIPRLNAAVLGESLATEDDQLILPNDQFSSNAHISSYHQVSSLFTYLFQIWIGLV